MKLTISVCKYGSVIVLPLLVIACSIPTNRAAHQAADAHLAVICETEDACRDMWTRASRWAEENAGWRFLRTEFNRIVVECYFARSDGYHIGYVIERVPLDGERSELRLTFGEDSGLGACVPRDRSALAAEFRQTVLG